jgi:hypothetical protein
MTFQEIEVCGPIEDMTFQEIEVCGPIEDICRIFDIEKNNK